MMNTKYLSSLLSIGLLAFGSSTNCRAMEARTVSVSPASAQVVLNGVDPSYGIVKWVHGAFIYRTRGNTAPNFVVMSSEGAQLLSFTATIPDAARVFVNDFDRAPDGSIVFSGSSYSAEGQHVPFICWTRQTAKALVSFAQRLISPMV